MSNCILYYGLLLHHVVVESYTLNPKAIHPNGRIPTSIAKAKRMTSFIKQEIEKNINDESIICLVDGNNIRNSFGYENMSALQLTELMSSWTVNSSGCDDIRPQIVVFWDGGIKCTSQKVLSTSTFTKQLAVYSGPDSADDIMVKCCAYITSKGSCIDDEQCTDKTNVLVFTSDTNLANRCSIQLDMGNRDADSAEKMKHQIYHSIHLCLLLLKGDDNEVRMNTNDQLAPWERSERRSSVDELETYLDSEQEKSRVDEGHNDQSRIGSIHEWINDGLSGIQIGRVTKGGSILYEIRE